MPMELGNINWKEIEVRLRKAQERSGCKRLKVAAMDIDDYLWAVNGPVLGDECTGKQGKCGCRHAELNLFFKKCGVKRLIITHSPCLNCSKLIVQDTAVKEVYFFSQYRNLDGIKYLVNRGVKCLGLASNHQTE